jgi:hypothetical protein
MGYCLSIAGADIQTSVKKGSVQLYNEAYIPGVGR